MGANLVIPDEVKVREIEIKEYKSQFKICAYKYNEEQHNLEKFVLCDSEMDDKIFSGETSYYYMRKLRSFIQPQEYKQDLELLEQEKNQIKVNKQQEESNNEFGILQNQVNSQNLDNMVSDFMPNKKQQVQYLDNDYQKQVQKPYQNLNQQQEQQTQTQIQQEPYNQQGYNTQQQTQYEQNVDNQLNKNDSIFNISNTNDEHFQVPSINIQAQNDQSFYNSDQNIKFNDSNNNIRNNQENEIQFINQNNQQNMSLVEQNSINNLNMDFNNQNNSNSQIMNSQNFIPNKSYSYNLNQNNSLSFNHYTSNYENDQDQSSFKLEASSQQIQNQDISLENSNFQNAPSFQYNSKVQNEAEQNLQQQNNNNKYLDDSDIFKN
ncbi:hypothetical protein PPERSA_05890 [Pseudocohnilembus persalinus]|uniref:Uncharacterized protein n=1 Tax=Pseudocohnilembus persalinus TaxID=266149 RepID=A0A0V0R4R1_PSEPJ|nr:hypothetical protein PPERSA_05890 [Pseudocohnilembus persalinus]|eukprot:KRX09221.1 hypothetical protein PPERSA_05890 [Pseudocohnilembus persalinus]